MLFCYKYLLLILLNLNKFLKNQFKFLACKQSQD